MTEITILQEESDLQTIIIQTQEDDHQKLITRIPEGLLLIMTNLTNQTLLLEEAHHLQETLVHQEAADQVQEAAATTQEEKRINLF